jgi:hypothetical protein
MRPTELVSANRVAILEQLSASIGQINQPISALVLNAEAALQLLLAQPTNTEAVRRLLVCIVKGEGGLRTGDIVRRSRALIEKAPPGGGARTPPRFGGQNALRRKIDSPSLDQCGHDWTPARSRSTISSSPSRALPAQRACLLLIGPEHWQMSSGEIEAGRFCGPARAEPNGRGEQDCGAPSCRRTETRAVAVAKLS